MLSLLEDTFIAVVDGDSLTAQKVVQAVRWQAAQGPMPDVHGDALLTHVQHVESGTGSTIPVLVLK